MNIYEKLLAIQNELKVPKNLTNKFGGYNYRNAESIYEELKPLAAKYKCVLVLTNFPQPMPGRAYMQSKATLIDCESEQRIEVDAYAEMEQEKKGMSLSQISGSATSYANKYACGNMFLLDDTKDADAEEYKTTAENKAKHEEAATSKKTSKKVTEEELKLLKSEALRTGKSSEFLIKQYKVKSITDLTIEQYTDAMNRMASLPDQKKEEEK